MLTDPWHFVLYWMLVVSPHPNPRRSALPGTEAGLRLNGSAPAAWQFVSDAQRNAFGQPRGYAVAFTGKPGSGDMP